MKQQGLYVNDMRPVRLNKVIWYVFLLILGSCAKQPGNHPPVIESILLDPSDAHTPGSDIIVGAMVTDRDEDQLQYFWESQTGNITNPNQSTAIWELSTQSEPLSYESITLTVSDGKEVVSSTKTIQITEGHIMSGYTYFAGTTIPVSGVELKVGKFTVVTDELGYYVFEHLKEGDALVTATKEGFESYESMVYVDFPKSTYNISLTSQTQTLQIEGTIATIDHITFQGLKVVLLNPDQSESDLQGITDETGSFVIDGVPLGSRSLLIRNETQLGHFLNDSLIYQVNLVDAVNSFNARIKIERSLISDQYMSESDKWIFEGSTGDGFYLLGKGQQLVLKDFISIPEDAEDAMLTLNSYVVGGCDLVGKLPSHRIWISNLEQEYLGGISWGGEGSNFSADVSWIPSDSPTFLHIYGNQIKLHFELFEENTCVPSPLWRIYQIEFSYYY